MNTLNENNNTFFQNLDNYIKLKHVSDCYNFFITSAFKLIHIVLFFISILALWTGTVVFQDILSPQSVNFLFLGCGLYTVFFLFTFKLYINSIKHNRRVLNNALNRCDQQQKELINAKSYQTCRSITAKAFSKAQEQALLIQDNEAFLNECVQSISNDDSYWNHCKEETVLLWKALIDEQQKESNIDKPSSNHNYQEPPLFPTD